MSEAMPEHGRANEARQLHRCGQEQVTDQTERGFRGTIIRSQTTEESDHEIRSMSLQSIARSRVTAASAMMLVLPAWASTVRSRIYLP